MLKKGFLLPFQFRVLGIVFLVIGAIAGIARFWFEYKPGFLTQKTFAAFSYYIDTMYFKFVKNNLGEEITIFFIVLGIYFVALAREKSETETTMNLRLKAFFISTWVNLIFLILATCFTYGFAFIYMLIVNIVVWPLSFILTFRVLMLYSRNRKL